MIPNVLAIAGSDPGGGAGIQADLKTFGALGCYGMAAVTAVTVQNTLEVRDILALDASFVVAQVEAVLADIRVDAIKVGMVATPEIAEALADCLLRHPGIPVVLDPVLASTSGYALGGGDVARVMRETLAPLAAVMTPNIGEAAALAGRALATSEADMEETARALVALGARAVLVKGGHLDGREAVDVLCTAEVTLHFAAPRVATRNTHGTGCTLSSAIAAFLASGLPLSDAVSRAKVYVSGAISAADELSVGHGPGPLHHFHTLRPV